ncbi:23S rRNA pseudouridine(1911/1915/1917) synthase RluD [Halopseudomonas salegens]|uniref:Pseudouridine synthase n=1 Tax=Halopseudomonas salegens TaxID=1434072 RepID=A0A1H2EFQ4_9GAMM|nr:23S rRNA pseudouridine(1911/1915/1917) synthase RluD [Halopseudomonas salegens]SDT93947.1 ribosomal large subunit pseudouridine synthase D [Halopseudomonas salegens]
MSERIRLSAQVSPQQGGQRLDQVAAQLFPDHSRSRLQNWIKSGELTVDGRQLRPRDAVFGGEELVLDAEREVQGDWQAEAIALDIVYEDDALLVINKPAGLVVHPAAGHHDGTLLNALLHHVPSLKTVPRAGIVHRLDKDTTGLMVVAKTLEAQTALVNQMQARTVSREYECVVVGVMTAGGKVDEPIARHGVNRQKMAVVAGGKEAISHYRVIQRYRAHTHVKVKLETGRTHQIRVHMAYIHYPLVGDPVYGGRMRIPPGASPELLRELREFPRQALHARRLELEHPDDGRLLHWQVPRPADMQHLLALLEEDAGELHD